MNDFLVPGGSKHLLMYYQEQEIDREGNYSVSPDSSFHLARK